MREQDCEQLEKGEEGIKLLVKGKLKDIPEISFKKPKTEKQKKEAKEKKETKKENKKNELNNLVEEIENNFEKFQSKKQIAQQSAQQPIPIYIPQYTAPTGRNLNVENLTEINNMILEKENELKEFYEEEFKKKWDEIEESYIELENRALEEDKEIAIREPEIPTIEPPVLPTIEPVPQPPSVIDDFELLPKPAELTPSQEFEYEAPQKSFADNVVDLLGIFDEEVLNKYKNMNPKLEKLTEINEEQDKLINSKQEQLNELNETIGLMENSINLSKGDIDKLESDLINRMNEIRSLTDENEKLKKMKEAEILSLQLNSSEDINELQEQLKIVEEERDKTIEELNSLKFMNIFDSENKTEEQEQVIQMNVSQAEQKLINDDIDNDVKTQFLRQYIDERLIPKQINVLDTMYETMNEILNRLGDDGLRDRIKTIIGTDKKIKQKKFIDELIKNKLSVIQQFKNEEALQNQIILERVEEAENEEKIKIITESEEMLLKIKKEYEELTAKKNENEEEIKQFENDLEEYIDEYESLVFTFETSLENANIEDIDEIDEIEDELEREQLLSLFTYIKEQKETLEPVIDDIKEKLLNRKLELDQNEITLLGLEEEIENLEKRVDNARKRFGIIGFN